MVPFLKGFLSNLNAVQSKQILRILSQMRDRGEIRNAKDFETKLADLANLIQKDTLGQQTPLFVFEEGELLESDAIRTFTDYLRLDLEVALGETERLSNSMRSHNRILSENYFDALEASLTELESETRAYEVLESQKFTGFSSVVKRWSFNDSISVPGADNDDLFVSSLFIDNRGKEDLFYSPPNKGDIGLHLGIDRSHSEYADFFDRIEILTDSTTPQTALSTSTAENIPVRAIDGNRDTAWRHSVLLMEHPSTVRLILGPSFVGARRVSALVIDPLSDLAMKIVSISYIDSGGKEVSLPIGASYAGSPGALLKRSGPIGDLLVRSGDWILSNTRKIIPVGDIIARKFIITLQQDTAGDGEFFYYNADIGNWVNDLELESAINGLMRERGGPDGMEIPLEFGFIGDVNEERRQGRFVEYPFGLKEISTITREYAKNGLFVPEPFEMSTAPSVLALYSDADFPVGDDTDIEFLIRKENYDSNGLLLDVETLPILPYGTDLVDERLFLSERHDALVINDTGVSRFYPDFSESFAVTRNDVSLVLGTDYTVSVDGVTFEASLPPTTTPIDPGKCFVKIINPQAGVLYAASYTPLVSTSTAGGEVWLNADHTVRLGRFQTYVFYNERSTGTVSKCKVGLQIILRANTLNTRVSPYLREAILLGG